MNPISTSIAWARLGLVIGSIVAALLLAEVLLRVFWTPWSIQSHKLFESHEIYGWAPRPGVVGKHATPEYVHTARNSRQGLRGSRVFGRQRGFGFDARVMLLGDSFTYGLGSADAETFVERFSQACPRVEVVNAGANGYSTRECLAVLDHLGAALAPDVSVYVFFWNDLDDNLKRTAPAFSVADGGRVERTDRPRPTTDPLVLQPPAVLETISPFGRLYVSDLIREGFKGFRYHTFGVKRRPVHTEKLKARAWEITEQLLYAMKLRAAQIGTKLVVACLPDHNQINAAAVIKNIGPLNYEVQAELKAVCDKHQILCVDLLPGMKKAWKDGGEDFYYYADRHLTPAGNAVVAKLLVTHLSPLLRKGR
jgi:hypothetical protein